MVTWQAFIASAPDLAAFATERLTNRIAYLATVRTDGGPRVHPVSPFIGESRLFVYMEPTSPKGHDLERDGRYALHCTVEDNDGGGGELYLSGRARRVDDPALRAAAFDAARASGQSPKERYVVFELNIESALATTYEGDQVVRKRWKP
jgi:hypothetical protein